MDGVGVGLVDGVTVIVEDGFDEPLLPWYGIALGDGSGRPLQICRDAEVLVVIGL